MIVIDIDQNSLTIDGHAGYAEAGKDIVCAAVSILAQNLIHSLEALTGDRIWYQREPGHIDIHFENLSGGGQLLIDSFFIGVSDIIAAYGDYVQLKAAEREGNSYEVHECTQ